MKTTIEISLRLSMFDAGMNEYTLSVKGRLPSTEAYAHFFPVALELLHHAGAPPLPTKILDDPEKRQ